MRCPLFLVLFIFTCHLYCHLKCKEKPPVPTLHPCPIGRVKTPLTVNGNLKPISHLPIPSSPCHPSYRQCDLKFKRKVKDLWHIWSIYLSAMSFAKFGLFLLKITWLLARGRGAKEADFVVRGWISKINYWLLIINWLRQITWLLGRAPEWKEAAKIPNF